MNLYKKDILLIYIREGKSSTLRIVTLIINFGLRPANLENYLYKNKKEIMFKLGAIFLTIKSRKSKKNNKTNNKTRKNTHKESIIA